MIRTVFATLFAVLVAVPAISAGLDDKARMFDSIDGGALELGGVALVTNTASLCAFSPQFDELQALHETYGPRGLTVLAVVFH